jgi:hypothetical protein
MIEHKEDVTDEVYFGELKIMFATDGWKILMWELADNARDINDIQDIKDQDELYFKRGQLATIAKLLNFEDIIERAEKDQEDEGP